MDKLTSALRALGDPTRRGILDLLRKENRSVTDLAEQFSMSRPAVSKHLGILREAGLVKARRAGRQQIYQLNEKALAPVYHWLQRYRSEATPPPPRRKARKARTGAPRSGATRRAVTRPGAARPGVARSDADGWKCW